MRRWPDWTLITTAGFLLAASNSAVALSAAVAPFVIAELLQGVARACFWTGSQTHVVRGPGRAVGALATVNLVSAVGLLGGPVLALVALAATVPTFLLDRLPPFSLPEDRPSGRLWQRPGVDVGCWAGVTAGAWRGLLSSYVPVALDAARQSSATIGALVSIANGASLAGAGLVSRARARGAARALAAGLGTGLTALVAGDVLLSALVLAVSGLGAGALQTVGPAIATESVHPEERGEAIAATGTFRAAALFAAPLAVSGLVGTSIMTVSALALRRRTTHQEVAP